MKTKVQLLVSLLAIPLLCFALRASATPITNIVTNGGFETGDFTGWTQGGNTSFTGVDMASAHSGNFGAFAGPTSDSNGSSGGSGGGPGTLSQNLATLAGFTYELSFFMYSAGESSFTNGFGTVEFQVFWNGVMIFDTTTPPASYTQFSFFNLTATGPSTELKFVFQNDPSFFHFDDVVAGITAVPETLSTLWLALPTLVMIGFLRLRRKTA